MSKRDDVPGLARRMAFEPQPADQVFVYGPTGSQDLIADASAVDLELVYTVGCDADTGMPTHSGRADIESGPHEKRALWRFDSGWHRAADHSNISPLIPVECTSLDVGTGALNDAAIVTERLDRDVNLFPTPERPREWPGNQHGRRRCDRSVLDRAVLPEKSSIVGSLSPANRHESRGIEVATQVQ